MRRVDDLTTGALRWGILTNGAQWRLYYQGARSVSEQFFELDLAALLALPGHNEGLFALTDTERHHWLKIFVLVFRREAFVAGATDPRTFHQRAIEDGRFYQERVAANLSELVFGQVFPGLARAIAAAAPKALLPDVREAALILLYRLLFILYAEDRDLLPVRDRRYDDYGLRENVRGDIGRRKDREDVFSTSAPPATGPPSMICAGPLRTATGPSAYRPITADCSTRPARRSSGKSDWTMRSWPPSSMRCRSSTPRTAAATSTTAISACSSSARSTSGYSNTTLFASTTRSRCVPTVSRGKGLGATTRLTTWSA